MKGYTCGKEGIISVRVQVALDRLPKATILQNKNTKQSTSIKEIDCPDCRKKLFRLGDLFNHILR
jgi:hypothetical protein